MNGKKCILAEMGNCGRNLLASAGLASTTTLWFGYNPAIAQIQPVTPNPVPLVAQSPVRVDAPVATNQLFVNPNAGSDASGNGSSAAPFKTIARALQVALPNTLILLAPGTYSTQTGEEFPLRLKPGVTIQGDPSTKGQNIVINGGAFFISPTFARQNITILGANRSTLTGVTVTNPNRRGYGLWIESSSPVVVENTFIGNTHDGISVTGRSTPLIRNNYFSQNGANGMTIYNTSQPEVRENVFENTGFGITVAQNSAPRLIGNRISRNIDGVVVHGKAQPILRENTIEGNSRSGLVAIAQSQPDLGTAAQPGGNIFRNNGRHDINTTASDRTIPAFGNQLVASRIVGRLDLAGTVTPIAPTPSVPPPPIAASTRTVPPPPPTTAQVQPLPPPSNPASPIAPVVINVPPPETGFVLRSSPTLQPPAPIPQPLPTLQQPLPAVRQSSNSLPSLEVQPGILPVPGAEIPVSTTTNSATVAVPFNSEDVLRTPMRGTRINPPPPTRAAALGFRYRVVVEVRTLNEQSIVRSIAPDAFRSNYRGRVVMQVGAYSDRTEADQMLQKMTGNGLNAVLEEL